MSHPICSVCLARSGVFVTEEGPDGDRVVCQDPMACCARRLAFERLNANEIGLGEFLVEHPSCEGFEEYRIIHGSVYSRDRGYVSDVPCPS